MRETKQDNFVKTYCCVLIITALIFFLRYLNYSLTDHGALDKEFTVFFRAAGNLSLLHISPYFNASTSQYYPYLYPPFFNHVLYPLGFLSFNAALFFWLFLQTALFLTALNYFALNHFAQQNKFILYALSLPFIINVLICGQTGLLTSAILLFGLAKLKQHPFLSGIILALVMFKPQLGIILPVVFLAGKNYKALVSFSLAVSVLVLSSLIIYGNSAWFEFFNVIHKHSLIMSAEPIGLFQQMVSIYSGLKILGLSNLVAILLHCTVALIATIIVIYDFYRDSQLSTIKLCALVYLISPYIFIYDTAMLSIVLYCLAMNAHLSIFNRLAMITGGFLPLLTTQAQTAGIPLGCITLIFICSIICCQDSIKKTHQLTFL